MTLTLPYYDDAGVTIHHGDALSVLRQLPDGIVQTCVTSPPYWGLRTYGVEGQLGLEATPEEFIANMVELFREVRRVLRDDGTCWINMGTSYFGGQSADSRDTSDTALSDCPGGDCPSIHLCDECRGALLSRTGGSDVRHALGLELCGEAPILVHTEKRCLCIDSSGSVHRIPNELSCLATHDRQRLQDHARERLGASLESMTPQSWPPPPDGCWHCGNCGACLSVLGSLSLDAELYVRKSGDTSGTGLPSDASVRRRSGNSSLGLACGEYSINLPRFKQKDLVPMPWLLGIALIGDGWFLRSEIIWSKPSPMPESCTDRPTKAHETILLLSKNPRYYYDADAVREEAEYGYRHWSNTQENMAGVGLDGRRGSATVSGSDPSAGRNKRTVWTCEEWHLVKNTEHDGHKSDVWDVSTESFKGCHFATYPRKLIEPCILAGANDRACAECGKAWRRVVESERVPTRPGRDTKVKVPGGWDVEPGAHGTMHRTNRTEATYRNTAEVGNRDPQRHVSVRTQKGHEPDCKCGTQETKPSIVLDPFMGSGTTAEVARKHGCHCIGIELNAEYIDLAAKRLSQGVLEFTA